MWPEDNNNRVDGITGAARQIQLHTPEEGAAIDFVQNYYNSPGFLQRFDNFQKNILPRYSSNRDITTIGYDDKIRVQKKPLIFNQIFRDRGLFGLENNGQYLPNGNIIIGDTQFDSTNPFYLTGEAGYGYDDVLAHELGHAVDNSIKLYKTESLLNKEYPMPGNYYSDLYPIFRNNKQYKQVLKTLNDSEKSLWLKMPSITGAEEWHDARPSESYADLMRLRYLMQKKGIFDSTKKDNVFTKDHLDKFKKSVKITPRLLNNFSEDDIIWMMNNVAQNDKQLNPKKAQA